MQRNRRAKIVATLGPASNTYATIRQLYEAGADVFRLNFSHGTHQDHQQTFTTIRQVEADVGGFITILGDLQGPKLRIGTFVDNEVTLKAGETFTLDRNPEPGTVVRVNLPHGEIYQVLTPGESLLLDDGKLRLQVIEINSDTITTKVLVGGVLSNRKGVNIPGVTLPISCLTEKDLIDLEFALGLGVDWVALSFVQRPEDIQQARLIVKDRAKLMAKIEKPMAMHHLANIVKLVDAVMVARGDLGVEMLPEEVPSAQKQIIRQCRSAGKPVVVATQMLDSMVHSPSPTRAEASDVATAIYDGVDAVMLSAETASGKYPVEAVTMMSRIIEKVESDSFYNSMIQVHKPDPRETVNDAMTAAARQVAQTVSVKAIVTYTESGGTALRETYERPQTNIIGITPNQASARRMGLYWGVMPLLAPAIHTFAEMVTTACCLLVEHGLAKEADRLIILAGVPFGESSGTNIMRIVEVSSTHLKLKR